MIGGKIKKVCLICNKEFEFIPCRKTKFSSNECKGISTSERMKGNQNGFTSENMSKENNPNWKGGISEDVHSPKEPRYKKWREAIFKRDNYTCRHCGEKGCYLEPHHIKSWSIFPKLRYMLSNGLALCLDCHSLTDNYRGKQNG